jgi:hypothetical protein
MRLIFFLLRNCHAINVHISFITYIYVEINFHVHLDYIGDVVHECTTLLFDSTTVRVLCGVVQYCDCLNIIEHQLYWLLYTM